LLVIPDNNGEILSFDTSLTETHAFADKKLYIVPVDSIDIDLDHQKEIISVNVETLALTVLRSDLSHPASFQMPSKNFVHALFSVKRTPGKDPVLVMFNENTEYHFSYFINPLYYSRWGIYAGIFLSVYLFILLIRKIQRIQLEKRFATEKKITELQMKIARNQMDPHFTMNAINAVIDAVRREETDLACDNLLHFSKMYRSLVLSADKIKRPLCEELEFTENYLALEKFRFGDRFTYKIDIDPAVDLSWEVPKMVIQSPVENAVKHGLLKKESGGEVVVHVFTESHNLILEITDNGIGREQSAKSEKTSTGKGMQIMGQFFDLYYKITGIRVTSEITDLNDAATGQTGTRATTTINLKGNPVK